MADIIATIRNPSPLPRRQWAVVTFPKMKVKGWADECLVDAGGARQWRAVRGNTIGNRTVYRVLVDLDGDETVAARLLNDNGKSPPFQMHPWARDRLTDLPATLQVALPDWTLKDTPPVSVAPTLLESTAAHQRWFLRQSIPGTGLWLDWWADVLHMDPVLQIHGQIDWSDRDEPGNNAAFRAFAIKTGEYLILDDAKRLGCTEPVRDGDGRWAFALGVQPHHFVDGSGLAFSGSMPCMPSEPGAWEDEFVEESLRAVRAAQQGCGHCYGYDQDWQGLWLPCGFVPGEYYGMAESMAADLSQWEASRETVSGWTGTRPLGAAKTPQQTGKQDGFGATKGHAALHDVRHLPILRHSVYAEPLRGGLYRERDGTTLLAADHDGWWTYNNTTHWHPSWSPDRLGKTYLDKSATGWDPYDEEHDDGGLYVAALCALTDDPLPHAWAQHWMEIYERDIRMRTDASPGAARAQGRRMQRYAAMLWATGYSLWADLIERRATRVAYIPTMAATPLCALKVNQPDGRSPVYIGGVISPEWSAWEHGLAVVGFYSAWRMHRWPSLREELEKLCLSLVAGGFMRVETEWKTVQSRAWADGAILTEPGTYRLQDYGGTGLWTLAGLRVAMRVLGSDHPLVLSTDLAGYLAGAPAPANRLEAEWLIGD